MYRHDEWTERTDCKNLLCLSNQLTSSSLPPQDVTPVCTPSLLERRKSTVVDNDDADDEIILKMPAMEEEEKEKEEDSEEEEEDSESEEPSEEEAEWESWLFFLLTCELGTLADRVKTITITQSESLTCDEESHDDSYLPDFWLTLRVDWKEMCFKCRARWRLWLIQGGIHTSV